ncbi:pyrroline-5-carboxylate reductase [Aquimarina agarilytica]|uniref:pyrroline-5-carboxylate reductase n=1 Tax=Aquimarina agarilytica TaxID=1087449 RepID=UPI000288B20C|nr:pyrroline-5-carboxylate reductase [Aquimarina agarilytica]
MNITVIGGGNMGLTYALSIHKNFDNASISILEKDEHKITELKNTTPFSIYNKEADCLASADIILLAIKPQAAVLVFEKIAQLVTPEKIIISIMAGVTMETIKDGLQAPKIVRAMPNLPAQLGKGVTGYMISESISENEALQIQHILSATGKAIRVYKEDDIDAITALSGSGPAYVFYFMNAMMEQAKTYGFSENDAKEIVLHTFLGTSNLFENSDDNAQLWIDKVTSKGGTTHAALTSFKSDHLDKKIQKGVNAAFERAKELAKS